jgi:hypothetical protein
MNDTEQCSIQNGFYLNWAIPRQLQEFLKGFESGHGVYYGTILPIIKCPVRLLRLRAYLQNAWRIYIVL